jgi:hypothetical protein
MKMTVLWDKAPCSLVEVHQCSICFYQTARRCIPEDCHLHTRRRENLKSHMETEWFSE